MAHSYDQWSVPNVVSVENMADDYPVIYINNEFASASIALHGGHVMSYQPREHKPLLWLSRDAIYKQGKAIRGGIPICWPWFGDHPTNPQLPAHGFARNQFWRIQSIKNIPAEGTFVTLLLSDTAASQNVWPFAFQLELTVLVGSELSVELTVTNKDTKTFDFTCALHAYLSLDDIHHTVIYGLESTMYIDKLQRDLKAKQDGNIHFDQELDRVYLQTPADVLIEDDDRTIKVSKNGSLSTVVWNPWIDKSSAMSDFHRDGYKNMVCVEPAITKDDLITLSPEQQHTLTTSLTLV